MFYSTETQNSSPYTQDNSSISITKTSLLMMRARHTPVCPKGTATGVSQAAHQAGDTPLDTSTQNISTSKLSKFAPRTQNTKQYSFATNHEHTCRLLHVFRAIGHFVTADLKENGTGVKFCFKLGETASAT
jgi:hypothetical protein